MATIQLTEALFYKGGSGGSSQVVGNDYEDSTVVSRVVRYTFTAPESGASRIRLTFHISGIGDGDTVPLRFFIGNDPESHANAGAESPYAGELTLADDWLSLSGEAEVLLIPGKTYYLWVFPAEDTYGWYKWYRDGFTSQLDTEGAAFLLPVTVGGAWKRIMLHVTIGGKWFLIALCAVLDGKWHYIGST